MIKQGITRIIVLVALVCLVGVGVRAQDVTSTSSTDTTTQLVRPLSFAPPVSSGSLAKPKPRPIPAGPGSGWVFFLGYSYLDTNITEGNVFGDSCNDLCDGRAGAPKGFQGSVTWMANPHFGLTADFSANFGGPTATDPDGDHTRDRLDTNNYYFLFGPTVAAPVGNVVLFAHGLVGLARLFADESFSECATCAFFREETNQINTGLAVGLGGGADWMFHGGKVGWRIIQVDWLWSDNNLETSSFGAHGSVSALRIGTGLVFNGSMR